MQKDHQVYVKYKIKKIVIIHVLKKRQQQQQQNCTPRKETPLFVINQYRYAKVKSSNPTETKTEPNLEVYFNPLKFFRSLRQLTKDVAPFLEDFFQLSFQFFIALSNTENKSMRSPQNITQCFENCSPERN